MRFLWRSCAGATNLCHLRGCLSGRGLAQREPHGRRSTTDFPASRFRLLLRRKEYCRQRIRVQTDCSSARITAPTWSVTGAAALGGAGMLTLAASGTVTGPVTLSVVNSASYQPPVQYNLWATSKAYALLQPPSHGIPLSRLLTAFCPRRGWSLRHCQWKPASLHLQPEMATWGMRVFILDKPFEQSLEARPSPFIARRCPRRPMWNDRRMQLRAANPRKSLRMKDINEF